MMDSNIAHRNGGDSCQKTTLDSSLKKLGSPTG